VLLAPVAHVTSATPPDVCVHKELTDGKPSPSSTLFSSPPNEGNFVGVFLRIFLWLLKFSLNMSNFGDCRSCYHDLEHLSRPLLTAEHDEDDENRGWIMELLVGRLSFESNRRGAATAVVLRGFIELMDDSTFSSLLLVLLPSGF